MLQLLEFIDNLALDDRLYWRLPREEGAPPVELMWQRAQKPEGWSVRASGTETWHTTTRASLPAALEALGVADATVEKMIGATVMTQAVFADMVLEGAARIFGREAVERSVKDTRSFLAEVSATASQLLGVKTASGQQGGAKAPAGAAGEGATRSSRLRLV